ncbi:hypothetical protein [Massilia scottii]|uniref:hypothetical protein n=1 Tax=Massilia scottii TaxID=3057166 RepID=UPI0027969D40|nr:hypothetical protein [Massilia sp. CCM 9029]MDQ1831623.1 hypothetical protein [Massilia sp. CCM 9029]
MAAAEAHDHAAGAAQKMTLSAGKKWATDQPLRQGMNAIRLSAAAILPLAHAGKANDAEYGAFATEVTAQVGYIVEHCKLEPRADAQLHIVIGAVMAGVNMAQGKQQGAKRSVGVVKVAHTLNTYGKYFDHPNWKPLALAH